MNYLQRINAVIQENYKVIKVLTDSSCKMKAVMDDKNV